jgi:hypothetical protein
MEESTQMTDEQLEQIITDLIERKYAAPADSAERQLILNQLNGLRHSYELAGPMMEDLDPKEWGVTSPRLFVEKPEGQLVKLRRPGRKAGSRPGSRRA